jgi:GNAT superfamily N-acetyltransferase
MGDRMAAAPDSPQAIRLLSPTAEDEWHDADTLIAELKDWDIQQSEALGFGRSEVIDLFYPDDIGDIRRHSIPPEGCFLVAMDHQLPIGCAAFHRLTPNACEAYAIYARPTHRGRGIGAMLLQRLLKEAWAAGYEAMCLETASFMLAAHKLYRSLLFEVRAPYRSIPARVADATMWMECRL